METTNIKYYFLDLIFMGFTLMFITFTWNIVGIQLFELKAITIFHSLAIILTTYTSISIYYGSKGISKENYFPKSKDRTKDQNLFLFSSFISGFGALFLIKLLFSQL